MVPRYPYLSMSVSSAIEERLIVECFLIENAQKSLSFVLFNICVFFFGGHSSSLSTFFYWKLFYLKTFYFINVTKALFCCEAFRINVVSPFEEKISWTKKERNCVNWTKVLSWIRINNSYLTWAIFGIFNRTARTPLKIINSGYFRPVKDLICLN